MYLRDQPTETLDDLLERMEVRYERLVTTNAGITPDAAGGAFRIDRLDGDPLEVPMSAEGWEHLSNWLDIPTAFMQRQDRDVRSVIASTLLARNPGEALVAYDDTGIHEIRNPHKEPVEPRSVVEVARKVIDGRANVVDYGLSTGQFYLDAIAPEGFDRGIGGESRVGDVTRGGLRFGLDRKQGLAPWVQRYCYRLVCTNGMETRDDGLRIDARGLTVDEVLAELEVAAEAAFSSVEAEIAAFYALREERVDNPERTLLRLAEESNLSDRMTMSLVERAGALGTDPSMFDLVNLVTNEANNPSVTRWNARRRFEQAGGQVVTEHAERCGVCKSRLH